jgi:hypothetical protein
VCRLCQTRSYMVCPPLRQAFRIACGVIRTCYARRRFSSPCPEGASLYPQKPAFSLPVFTHRAASVAYGWDPRIGGEDSPA